MMSIKIFSQLDDSYDEDLDLYSLSPIKDSPYLPARKTFNGEFITIYGNDKGSINS